MTHSTSLKGPAPMTTQAQVHSSLASERSRNADEAIAMSDCRTLIRDCEDACALLLKDFDSDAVYTILNRLEDAKGTAGGRSDELK